MVIYHDGSCESLSSGIESRKNTIDQQKQKQSGMGIIDVQNQTILYPNIFILRDGRRLLTYFLQNQKDNSVHLVTSFLNDEDLKSIHTAKYLLHREGLTLAGFTVVEGQNFPSLLTICN